ncbi:MAG: response regulator transcription factor [Paludibacteraceae bacterium]|nr:response regulator transcription factor [Paludibacteraceae bacterium]
MNKCNIVLIEPSHIIAEGMRRILESVNDLSIIHVSERITGIDVHVHKADVIILNPRVVTEGEMVSTLHNLRKMNEQASVIALHTHYESTNVMKHFEHIIELGNDTPSIIEKIRSAQTTGNENKTENDDLSIREKEVLVAVAKGLTNKEIAEALNISIHTVIAHRKNITSKIGIKSIPGLTLYAMTNGLLEP